MSTDSEEPRATITASSPLVAPKTSIWSESEDGTGSVVLSTSHMRRRYYLALFERSLAVSCAIALLVVSMWSYAGIKSLGKWQKRTFNLLSILSTGIMTLGLGSLLGYLGAMIRWPLLACRRGHSVEDIDLILAMAPPTGALRLIYAQVKGRRWTRTTLVAVVYLFINVAGRLSVAVFGLSFNIEDQPGVLHPATMSNWSTTDWIHPKYDATIPTDRMTWRDFNVTDDTADRFWLYAEQGLLDFSENIRVAPEPNPTFNIKTMHRTILGDTVIFSYPLRKYRGNDGVASNITINSSAKCKRRPVHAIGHDTSVSLPTIVVNATYPQLEEESLAFLYSAFQSSEVLLKHHVAGSVRTASDQVLRNKCSSTYMYLEDANGFREQWNRAGTILTCDVCIAIDYPSQKYDQELDPIYNYNSKLLLWLPTFGKIAGWGSKYNITVRDYFDEGRRSFCSGLGTVFGNAQSPLKPQESELYAATLLARIPVLAIARADKGLPQKSLNGRALENYVLSKLEVKWARVGWIAAALMSGQFLVIAFVLWYCCYMKIPEDSPVPTAEILKEVTSGMTEVHGGLFRYDGRNIVRACASKEV